MSMAVNRHQVQSNKGITASGLYVKMNSQCIGSHGQYIGMSGQCTRIRVSECIGTQGQCIGISGLHIRITKV